MPYRYVVPNYKGNYKTAIKFMYFFLKGKELSDVWIRKIKRENVSPTKFSRVSIFYIKNR